MIYHALKVVMEQLGLLGGASLSDVDGDTYISVEEN